MTTIVFEDWHKGGNFQSSGIQSGRVRYTIFLLWCLKFPIRQCFVLFFFRYMVAIKTHSLYFMFPCGRAKMRLGFQILISASLMKPNDIIYSMLSFQMAEASTGRVKAFSFQSKHDEIPSES